MEARDQRRLGEILMARGALAREQLEAVIAEQERTGRLFGELVVTLGFASSSAVAAALAEQRGWSETEPPMPHPMAGDEVPVSPVVAEAAEWREPEPPPILVPPPLVVPPASMQSTRPAAPTPEEPVAAKPPPVQQAGEPPLTPLAGPHLSLPATEDRDDAPLAADADAEPTTAGIAGVSGQEPCAAGKSSCAETVTGRAAADPCPEPIIEPPKDELPRAALPRQHRDVELDTSRLAAEPDPPRPEQPEQQAALVRAGELTTPSRPAADASSRPTGEAATDPSLSEDDPQEQHLLFLPSPSGYLLLERPGAAPARGATIELDDGHGQARSYLVLITAPAPLPDSRLRCAYLHPL